jgi:hypothetical protein
MRARLRLFEGCMDGATEIEARKNTADVEQRTVSEGQKQKLCIGIAEAIFLGGRLEVTYIDSIAYQKVQ